MKKYTLALLTILMLTAGLNSCFFDSEKSGEEKKTQTGTDSGTITGVVTDEDGHPLPGVAIVSDTVLAISDSAGSFTIRIPQGEHALMFVMPGYRDTVLGEIDVKDGMTVTIEDLVMMKPLFASIKGSVKVSAALGGAGVSLRGIGVEVPRQNLSAVTTSSGAFFLDHVTPEAAEVIAAKSGVGWGSSPLSLKAGQALENVVITLNKAGGSVTGIVTDENGLPVSGASVSAVGGGLTAVTDADGRYRLEHVPANVPISVRGEGGQEIGGLMVDEESQLDGINLSPQGSVKKKGIEIHNTTVVSPEAGGITVAAAVDSGSSAAGSIALYMWDTDGDGKYDTLSGASHMDIPSARNGQVVTYGVILTTGDTVGGAQIRIARDATAPRADAGANLSAERREQVLFNPSVTCRTGGIISYHWDFDGNGTWDWTRSDGGRVAFRYFQQGTYKARFKVIASSGETAEDSLTITVLQQAAVLPADAAEPPVTLFPEDGSEVGLGFRALWDAVQADSYSVYLDTKMPPDSLIASGLTDTSIWVTGLLPSTTYYFGVASHRGGTMSQVLSIRVISTRNQLPVFQALGEVMEGDSLLLSWLAEDSDSPDLEYRVFFGPGDSLTAQGSWSSLPEANVRPSGGWQRQQSYKWQVRARDGVETVESLIRIFTYSPPNTAPEFTTLKSEITKSVVQGNTWSDTARASDPDGDSLTMNLAAAPSGMTLSKGILAWTPAPADTGIHSVLLIASDGKGGTDTLSWNITVSPSANASLKSLSVTEGALSPGFVSGTLAYRDTVPSSTSAIRILPAAVHPGAVIKVNDSTVASGSLSPAFSLQTGINRFDIIVTAADGATQSAYIIRVVRLPSSNALLSSLVIPKVVFHPLFTPAQGAYWDTVLNTVSSVSVTPSAQDLNATILVANKPVKSDSASGDIPLAVGDNLIEVLVTAQDGVTKKTYTIRVHRLRSSNADLSALTLTSGSMTPAFNPGITFYTDSINLNTNTIRIVPTAAHSLAAVTVDAQPVASGDSSQPFATRFIGSQLINIVVTAEDGTVKSYAVNVVRFNAPPVISFLPNQTIDFRDSTETLALDDIVTDPDHHDSLITWSARIASATGAFTTTDAILDTGGRLFWVSTANMDYSSWSGMDSVILIAQDRLGAADTAVYILSVAGWEQIGFDRQPNDTPNDIFFPSAQTGYIVTENGYIHKTVNGGDSWTYTLPGQSFSINTVHFQSDNTGWIAGSGGNILRTANGGDSWIPAAGIPPGDMRSIHFAGARAGWCIGQPIANEPTPLVHTGDGGVTWDSIVINPAYDNKLYNDVFCFGYDTAYIAGSEFILRTRNGGATWTAVSYPGNTFYDVYFINASLGWAGASGDKIYRTVNGGTTWTPIDLPVWGMGMPQNAHSVHFTDPSNGWLAVNVPGYSTMVYKSSDGGLTWKMISGSWFGQPVLFAAGLYESHIIVQWDDYYRYNVNPQ